MQLVYGLLVGILGFILTYNGYPFVPVLLGTQALYWSTLYIHLKVTRTDDL